MAAKAPTWYNGSVSKAATLAFRLKLILLACVVDKDSSKNKEKIDDILQSEKILPLVKRHCLCIRIDPDAAEQEALFVKELKATETPCICIFHSSGNVLLSGGSLNKTQLFAKLVSRVHGHGSNDTEDSEYAELFERNSQLHEQRQEALRKLYMAENGKKENDERHISTIEAERYRKMLVKERRENHEQLKRLRSDIRNDRETYKMLHGETKNVTAVDKCEVSTKAEENKVRLLFRLSNGEAKEESFGKDAKFSTVREYIESTMGVVKSRSEIVLVRPWRVFDGDVDGRTLQELGLAPSATLLVRVWNTAPPGSTRNSPLTSRGLMLAVVVGILAAFLWWYRNGNTMPKRPVYLTLPPPAID
ncbi:hypothetical protein IW140_006083 [Coemansia sp. RSA 1813]|nr:hypothetical protein EV178_006034 [Coemansia sp. RSA 1646]KAJ1772969.1 hypothetical protein LPJ74_001110 [Coemansia sp. RSA 1843]KAJ2210731.1 hypothetical protein EV179_006022 [Coemansia sp. RSA 487]KAJ2563525.1 hypothetical protein IW140_006083 [Coemansia sp. RSA 1813]